MAAKPASIDQFLASLPPAQRAALTKLRRAIRSIVPDAEEGISYGLPAFRLNGRPLAAFGAGKRHCAFYPMSGKIVAAHQDLLAGFETSKGAVRFQPDRPLPVSVLRKLIRARQQELAVPKRPRTR